MIGSIRSAARLVAGLALTAVLVGLAGCSGGATVEDVTVQAGSVTVTVPQALVCAAAPDKSEALCQGGETDENAPHLRLAPGAPLDIKVPQKVGDTPWVVVFSYTDANGDPQGDRTAVFPAEDRYSYQLTPPKGAQLTRLEVQSLTAAPGADGGVEFPAVGTWVLVIDPPTATAQQ